MDAQRVAIMMRDYVRRNPATLFGELQSHLRERGVDVDGHIAMALPQNRNLVTWIAMSELFAEGYLFALEQDWLEERVASPLSYLSEGHIPDIPMVNERIGIKRILALKTPRWIPMAIYPTANGPRD